MVLERTCVFIGLGSNLGDRQANIAAAIAALERNSAITIEKVSSFIETEPCAGPTQGKYINAVIKLHTVMAPEELLKLLLRIEKSLGRARTVKNAPRTIDLDILLYGDKIIRVPGLTIPHPRMFEREFVMRPLLEIEPDLQDHWGQSSKKPIPKDQS